MLETGRRFINTWECDENDHLNVQFYFAHFQEAEPHFWIDSGIAAAGSPPRIVTRHVRYHREMRVGDMTVIRSALARDDAGQAFLLHRMEDPNGTLMATSLNRLDTPFEPLRNAAPGAPAAELDADCTPRSVTSEPDRGARRQELEEAGYLPTYRGQVMPRDCDETGNTTTRMHIASLSDSAGHIWLYAGMDQNWLEARNLGRVAVEQKLTPLAPLKAGDPVLVLSAVTDYRAKTITMHNYIINVSSGEAAMVAQITALAIDQKSRKAVAWPDEVVEQIARLKRDPQPG
jgi:acyl-CoA thioester hydrolase